MDCVVTVSITDMKLGYDAKNIVNQIDKESKISDLEALINKAFHYEPVTVSEVEQYLITNKKLIYKKLGINDFAVLNVVTEGCYHRWIDKCGNTWDADIHSYEAAVAFAHELQNCANCHECFKCTDCRSCSNCVSCTNCECCEECENCVTCLSCTYCKGCTNCECCAECENCSILEFSQGCADKHNSAYIKGGCSNEANI